LSTLLRSIWSFWAKSARVTPSRASHFPSSVNVRAGGRPTGRFLALRSGLALFFLFGDLTGLYFPSGDTSSTPTPSSSNWSELVGASVEQLETSGPTSPGKGFVMVSPGGTMAFQRPSNARKDLSPVRGDVHRR